MGNHNQLFSGDGDEELVRVIVHVVRPSSISEEKRGRRGQFCLHLGAGRRKSERAREEGKKRSFQVCLFADKGKQWTARRTGWVGSQEGGDDRAHLAMAERGGIFFGNQGRLARSAVLPLETFRSPLKRLLLPAFWGIHFASITHANCGEGEEERNVSHAFIQPLMMPLLSKMLEGRRDATIVKRGRQERQPLEMPPNQTAQTHSPVWPDRSE